MSELVFEVTQEEDGGFCARAVGEGIYTQGDTWQELRAMVLDATNGYFDDSEPPARIRLHLLRDEVVRRACRLFPSKANAIIGLLAARVESPLR